MDGDGTNDLITGSYTPGHLYFYKGKKDGTFDAGVKLTDETGKEIAISSASAPVPIDWNRDGKLDLIVGFITGKAKLLINKGDLKFGEAQDVMVGGVALEGSKLRPTVADWDRDGTLDLIVGSEKGRVTFYKGTKAASGYSFAEGKLLIDDFTRPAPNRPNSRPVPTVVDWNNDGKLDLVVGDFSSQVVEPANLTDEMKAKRDSLTKEQRDLLSKLNEIRNRILKSALTAAGYEKIADVPTEKRAELLKQVQDECMKDADYAAAVKHLPEVSKELLPLRAKSVTAGFVWVYLRK